MSEIPLPPMLYSTMMNSPWGYWYLPPEVYAQQVQQLGQSIKELPHLAEEANRFMQGPKLEIQKMLNKLENETDWHKKLQYFAIGNSIWSSLPESHRNEAKQMAPGVPTESVLPDTLSTPEVAVLAEKTLNLLDTIAKQASPSNKDNFDKKAKEIRPILEEWVKHKEDTLNTKSTEQQKNEVKQILDWYVVLYDISVESSRQK